MQTDISNIRNFTFLKDIKGVNTAKGMIQKKAVVMTAFLFDIKRISYLPSNNDQGPLVLAKLSAFAFSSSSKCLRILKI